MVQEQWKVDIARRALLEEIINDPQWLEKLDEPMPVWAILEIAVRLVEKLDPPSATYD